MAAFIPVSTSLRKSFLRRIELSIPLSTRSISDQDIKFLDLHVYCLQVYADCCEEQRLSLRDLVPYNWKDNAWLLPRGCELNKDRIGLKTLLRGRKVLWGNLYQN